MVEKRIFKLNGLRYSLDEIEKKINNQINGECAIIQTNDILTLFFNEKNDIKNIYLLLTKNFKIEKKVFKLKKIKKIPLNNNNKINYNKLKNYLL